MGELFYRDQRPPESVEVSQAEQGVNYWAQSPSTYAPSGREDSTRPPGNNGPEDRDQYDASSAKVIPPEMHETIRNQVLARYLKTAVKMDDILAKTGPSVHQRADKVLLNVKRFSPKTGFWTFEAVGTSGQVYTVRLKGVRKSKAIKNLAAAEIQCSCSCPFWRWQGPEHWGKVNGFLYGTPRGTASFPVIKDPKEKHWGCKHIVAALKQAQTYRWASLRGWTFNGVPVPLPDPGRVAERFAQMGG